MPIEEGIAPLVYELNRFDMFKPCWSCEGHLGPKGDLWKVPRVWFYCSSVVHVRLLSDVLAQLQADRATHVPWRVRVTFSDVDNPDTTFSLRPDIFDDDECSLEKLQQDVRIISERLEPMIASAANRVLGEI